MIYTDGTHLVADTLEELHQFCKLAGIKKCWYEGYRKGHPHYDIPDYKKQTIMNHSGVKFVRPREVLAISKKMIGGEAELIRHKGRKRKNMEQGRLF